MSSISTNIYLILAGKKKIEGFGELSSAYSETKKNHNIKKNIPIKKNKKEKIIKKVESIKQETPIEKIEKISSFQLKINNVYICEENNTYIELYA